MAKIQLKEVPGPRRKFKVGIKKEELQKGLENYARLEILEILGVKGMIGPSKLHISAD
jgi:hypothetical protein